MRMGRKRVTGLLLTLVLGSLFAGAPAHAQTPVKLAISADMSGPYVDTTGPGQTVAAQLAIEDFGGKVLGRPIQLLSADDGNKPDIASANTRRWIESEGIDAIVGGGNSATALAILTVAREKNRAFLIVGAGNPDFAGKNCSPISTQWAFDTFAQAATTGQYLTGQAGGGSWFFITADYAFGHALERDTTRIVRETGGKVLGAIKSPLGTFDYSSFLLQAQASGAKTVGLAIAGQDLINAVKQAGEFGVGRGQSAQRLAGLSLFSSDIPGIGLQNAQGLIASESFYWDRDEGTRAFTKRFMEQRPGRMPNMLHAHVYAAVAHYLKAVQATGTTDARTVTAKMKEVLVEDFVNKDVRIREDGRVLNSMHVIRVKEPARSSGPFDVVDVVATLPGEQVFRSMAEGGCQVSK